MNLTQYNTIKFPLCFNYFLLHHIFGPNSGIRAGKTDVVEGKENVKIKSPLTINSCNSNRIFSLIIEIQLQLIVFYFSSWGNGFQE